MAEQMMQETAGKAIPAGYKQTEVGVIPEDWGVFEIQDLIYDLRGGAPFKPSDFTKQGVKVLPKGGVVRGGILKIKEIQDYGETVSIEILRHGLSNKEAFEVESAIIDYIGKKNLTNIVLGHDSHDRGRMSLTELEIKYGAQKAIFELN